MTSIEERLSITVFDRQIIIATNLDDNIVWEGQCAVNTDWRIDRCRPITDNLTNS